MIDVDDLASAIAEELSDYTDEVIEKVDQNSKRVSRAAVKVLKTTSPKLTGDYAKSWAVKTDRRFGMPNQHVIYVKDPEYRLTHLLENGHVNADGGRSEPKVHIKPVEEMVKTDFVKGVKKAIETI